MPQNSAGVGFKRKADTYLFVKNGEYAPKKQKTIYYEKYISRPTQPYSPLLSLLFVINSRFFKSSFKLGKAASDMERLFF